MSEITDIIDRHTKAMSDAQAKALNELLIRTVFKPDDEPPLMLVQQTSPDGTTTRWWFEKKEPAP